MNKPFSKDNFNVKPFELRSGRALNDLEQEVFLWKRKLKVKPKEALQDIDNVILKIKDLKPQVNVSKVRSSLLNGCSVPSDYSRSKLPYGP